MNTTIQYKEQQNPKLEHYNPTPKPNNVIIQTCGRKGNEMENQMAKKLVTSHTFSGTFPSPESPPPCSEDGRAIGNNTKGWYSERVPVDSSYRGRKGYVAAAALVPFSSGRALPSKWDDAERWISSPISSVGNVSTSGNYFCGTGVHNKASHLAHNSQRRAKSKSGPLGPAGLGFYGGGYNTFSPVLGVGVINGGQWRNSVAVESPASARVQLDERLGNDDGSGGGGGDDGRRRSCPGHSDPEWLDLWSGPLSPSDKGDMNMPNDAIESINDDNIYSECYNDDARVDRAISRRDMATQMYPESDSSCPSYAMSSARSSISTNSPRPLLNQPNRDAQSQEFEVRDVQIDRQPSRATQRWPSTKENKVVDNSSNLAIVDNEDNKNFKLQGEEARINAWENLQKAKAESAIQRLEMKLEKKRATSLEKIIEKLRRAEIKAQKMRSSLANHSNDLVQNRVILKNSFKIPSICRKLRLSSSTRSCSTCYPF